MGSHGKTDGDQETETWMDTQIDGNTHTDGDTGTDVWGHMDRCMGTHGQVEKQGETDGGHTDRYRTHGQMGIHRHI